MVSARKRLVYVAGYLTYVAELPEAFENISKQDPSAGIVGTPESWCLLDGTPKQ